MLDQQPDNLRLDLVADAVANTRLDTRDLRTSVHIQQHVASERGRCTFASYPTSVINKCLTHRVCVQEERLALRVQCLAEPSMIIPTEGGAHVRIIAFQTNTQEKEIEIV